MRRIDYKRPSSIAAVVITVLAASACMVEPTPAPTDPDKSHIDRHALVTRHNPEISSVDPMSPLMVGNGEFALAVDITGLQSFRQDYSAHSPLLTQAQWAWHSFENPEGYQLSDALKTIEVNGQIYMYPYIEDWSELDTNPALRWLRENPHRYSLGRLSFTLDGESKPLELLADIKDSHQTLDLWNGEIRSSFSLHGSPVEVSTRVHPKHDMLLIEVTSPLVQRRRLGVELAFPYVSNHLNPDPADWNLPDRHKTTEVEHGGAGILLRRELDDTKYWVDAVVEGRSQFEKSSTHKYVVFSADNLDTLRIMIDYSEDAVKLESTLSFDDAVRDVRVHWQSFWSNGAAIEFSQSSDPRAHELERRVVLSQYLTAVNSAGSMIPQEEGLYSNSWNGKFHHEMHWWHSAHFALWNRDELLKRSMGWYADTLETARQRAAHYGRTGAWWPKMTGPAGRESPSTINPFIIWQQPHPIYLAELLYRSEPTAETLDTYETVVFETAELLASYPTWDEQTQRYVVGPPLVPAQETYDPHISYNPTFELAYFDFGLRVAQRWRERLGLKRDEKWDRVLKHLSKLPERDGLYLPTESSPNFWIDALRKSCGGGSGMDGGITDAQPVLDATCTNRDHPSFLAAFGLLPGDTVYAATMRNTLSATNDTWDFRQTWGWDFPMLAMTAARLGEADMAIDYLLADTPNNTFGIAGMTPRYHLGAHGFVKNADTYFPSNGSLLAAVAMMAAGWDGAERDNPGFPDDGTWVVNWEGLQPLP